MLCLWRIGVEKTHLPRRQKWVVIASSCSLRSVSTKTGSSLPTCVPNAYLSQLTAILPAFSQKPTFYSQIPKVQVCAIFVWKRYKHKPFGEFKGVCWTRRQFHKSARSVRYVNRQGKVVSYVLSWVSGVRLVICGQRASGTKKLHIPMSISLKSHVLFPQFFICKNSTSFTELKTDLIYTLFEP